MLYHTDGKQLFNLLCQNNGIYMPKLLWRPTCCNRVSNEESDRVTFGYNDYADEDKQKQMTLTIAEFIRRFTQHILPERFTKIRTYGYLANRGRHDRIKEVLQKMELAVRILGQFSMDVKECPACKNKTLQLVKYFIPGNMQMMDNITPDQIFLMRI